MGRGGGLDRTEVGQMRALVSTSAARTGGGAWLRQARPERAGVGFGVGVGVGVGGQVAWMQDGPVHPRPVRPELVEGLRRRRALALTGLTRTDFSSSKMPTQ